MAGMTVNLLSSKETDQLFGQDPIFQNLLKERDANDRGISPQALEIIYNGTGSANYTEIGTAATAEFDGGAKEKTTVAAATRVNTPGGSYFTFEVISSAGVITKYYAWFSKYQVTTVQCLAAASFSTGAYFTIADSQGSPTKYYVWMDKNGDGTTDDPGPITGYTSAAVNVSAATTADQVATAVAGVLNALAGFGASAVTDTVTITHATKGAPSEDAVDEDTGFTITLVEDGGSDPAVSGYTGAECDIKGATTAADVGTIIQGVITALSDITATGTATVTMINDNQGNVADTTDGAVATGFTITQVEIGRDALSGAPIYFKSTEANDTDAASGDMRKVTAIGTTKDTLPKLQSEEKALSGTTIVKSSEILWERIIHVKGSDWGTGGQDAKGTVSMVNVDAATTYLSIAVGSNESEGGVIWVPNDWHALVAEMQLDLNAKAIATAGDGATVRFEKSGFDQTKNNRLKNLDPDNKYIPIMATRENPHAKIKYPQKTQMHGTDVAKLTLTEALVNTTVEFTFRAYVLMWYGANTASS